MFWTDNASAFPIEVDRQPVEGLIGRVDVDDGWSLPSITRVMSLGGSAVQPVLSNGERRTPYVAFSLRRNAETDNKVAFWKEDAVNSDFGSDIAVRFNDQNIIVLDCMKIIEPSQPGADPLKIKFTRFGVE